MGKHRLGRIINSLCWIFFWMSCWLMLVASAQSQTCASIPLGFNIGANGGSLGGFVPYPYSSFLHQNISALPADPNSVNYINDASNNTDSHFYISYGANNPGGMANGDFSVEGDPFYVVDHNTPRMMVSFDRVWGTAHLTTGSSTATWVKGYLFAGNGGDRADLVPGNSFNVSSRMASDYWVGPGTNFTITSVDPGGHSLTFTGPWTGPTGDYAFDLSETIAESDVAPVPVPIDPYHQGAYKYHTPNIDWAFGSTTDGHIYVVDRDDCLLYSLYAVQWDGHSLHTIQESITDLKAGDFQRPNNWTSDTVSGLNLFAGFPLDKQLLGEEPLSHPLMGSAFGGIIHFARTDPATHAQGANNPWTPDKFPIGAKLRLKSSFDIAGFCSALSDPTICVNLLTGLRDYGYIPTDGGQAFAPYMPGGTAMTQETVFLLRLSTTIFNPANFDVVITSPIYCPTWQVIDNGGVTPMCPHDVVSHPAVNGIEPGNPPIINPPSVSGRTVTFTVTNAMNRLAIVMPYVGAIVSNATAPPWNGTYTFTAPKSGTYTINVKNFWGEQTQTVVVP